jgi:hypothetical protein
MRREADLFVERRAGRAAASRRFEPRELSGARRARDELGRRSGGCGGCPAGVVEVGASRRGACTRARERFGGVLHEELRPALVSVPDRARSRPSGIATARLERPRRRRRTAYARRPGVSFEPNGLSALDLVYFLSRVERLPEGHARVGDVQQTRRAHARPESSTGAVVRRCRRCTAVISASSRA